jgi:hypothetical protein
VIQAVHHVKSPGRSQLDWPALSHVFGTGGSNALAVMKLHRGRDSRGPGL